MKIKELRERISEEDLDAFLATKNARYLTDTPAGNAIIVKRKGAILLCSRLDFYRAKRESKIKNIIPFSKNETPLRKGEDALFGKFGEVIGRVLAEQSIERLGYDKLGDETLEQIGEKSDVKCEKKEDMIWELRKTKTREEIERMKMAAKIATEGMKRASELIETGRTELEIAAEIEYRMRKLGSEGTAFDTVLASGEDSWLPHTEATERKLGKEELVTVDLGARWKGYRSDMTRTFSISPNSDQEEILEITEEAQKAGLEKVGAGVKAKEVDEAAREVFREHGYEEFYTHSTGHGVGLDIHEPPSLDPSTDDELKENMVITVEPGVYVRDVGGSRFEDMIIVKEDGYENLTSF